MPQSSIWYVLRDVLNLLSAPDRSFAQTLENLGRPLRFAEHRQPLCWNLLHHSRIALSVMWFCVVLGPRPPLHHHNWLSFGKSQDTERFLILCARHVSSRLPSSGETCKFAMAPITQTNRERFFLLCLSWVLRCRVRKFRTHVWIAMYIVACKSVPRQRLQNKQVYIHC
jgi:hypothetical protein